MGHVDELRFVGMGITTYYAAVDPNGVSRQGGLPE